MPLPENILTRVPTQNDDLAWRIVDDECIIVDPVGSQATVLNSLGASIWSLIDGKRTVSEIVDGIVAEYDVSRAVAEVDAKEFFESLFDRKLAQL